MYTVTLTMRKNLFEARRWTEPDDPIVAERVSRASTEIGYRSSGRHPPSLEPHQRVRERGEGEWTPQACDHVWCSS